MRNSTSPTVQPCAASGPQTCEFQVPASRGRSYGLTPPLCEEEALARDRRQGGAGQRAPPALRNYLSGVEQKTLSKIAFEEGDREVRVHRAGPKFCKLAEQCD
jgi:hypothetical protein